MQIDVVLGLQWGDEGKGKIVDKLSSHYDIVARYQGGPNAGHTLVIGGKKIVLHTLPSGMCHPKVRNVIGNGVIIDPITLRKEIKSVMGFQGCDLSYFKERLFISSKAHLILPTHRLLDRWSEERKGERKIGSTQKGISPCYTDKVARRGLTVQTIFSTDFEKRYRELKNDHLTLMEKEVDEDDESEFFEGIDLLRKLTVSDTEIFLYQELKAQRKILAEGAQGTLLDLEFGTYPFVTSSHTIAGGVCAGLGVSPRCIGEIYGVFKSYTTRVGNGPFPTELLDERGDCIRKKGNEFGSTTGRLRRCGWLDMPLLKYAIMLNGVTQLVMVKADVLAALDTVQVATDYLLKGEKEKMVSPTFQNLSEAKPVLKGFKSWKIDLNERRFERLDACLQEYIEFIETETGVPIKILSLGPDREQTLVR